MVYLCIAFRNICGAYVYTAEDGTTEVELLNDQGNWLFTGVFDADGTLITGSEAVYAYDSMGRVARISYQIDGILTSADEYAYTPDGKGYISKMTQYEADGSFVSMSYNFQGELIGNYAQDAEGNVLEDMRTESVFDSDGNLLEEHTYYFDELQSEKLYAQASEDGKQWTYCACVTDYYGDQKMETTYNAFGDILTETQFDDQGRAVSQYRWDYSYNPDKSVDTITVYLDGMETENIHYIYDAQGVLTMMQYYYGDMLGRETVCKTHDGMLYESQVTEYNADGSKTVYELSIDGKILSQVSYDPEGNPVG